MTTLKIRSGFDPGANVQIVAFDINPAPQQKYPDSSAGGNNVHQIVQNRLNARSSAIQYPFFLSLIQASTMNNFAAGYLKI
ncbi:MAG: hypothetical protein HOP11_05290 [Saprospiraceae bacterium]|nr:hypothetical protein [Saprospiraceae bacterium]